jgi:GDP-L-fucose synthase
MTAPPGNERRERADGGADHVLAGRRIFVAGHRGMVGSAIIRRLRSEDCEIITVAREALDLRDQSRVHAYLAETRPHIVVLAAAKVGGILANDTYPVDFLYDNLAIETNVIGGAFRAGVERLLFLGSACVYPKLAPQPIPEDALLTASLEPTNEWYGVAKIAGIKLCEAYRRQYGADYISAMPTNLYGPGDNFNLLNSHVLPALLRKAHEAKLAGQHNLVVWGSGKPRREFLHVDDCADALVFLLKKYSGARHINVGSGEDQTIADLARLVMQVVGLEGELQFDLTKADGTPRKLLDSATLTRMGWAPRIGLKEGLVSTYKWFLDQHGDIRLG